MFLTNLGVGGLALETGNGEFREAAYISWLWLWLRLLIGRRIVGTSSKRRVVSGKHSLWWGRRKRS